MSEITANVDWTATILGAAFAFGSGWLWYSPKLLVNKCAEGVGHSLDAKSAPPAMAMKPRL